MLRRLLSRQGIGEPEREAMLASVEERGCDYLPQVNAFYIHEFQMIHAAEDAARFLHQACQGLPLRLNAHSENSTAEKENGNRGRKTAIDDFYSRVIEHAVADFGSRVLHPSRPAPEDDSPLSRAACEKAAQSVTRGDKSKFEPATRDLGYLIGSQIYAAYLAGKVSPGGLRRLFLAHLNEPGLARKVCIAVVAKLRAAKLRPASRPLIRAAHA
jgi:hypothetical protein